MYYDLNSDGYIDAVDTNGDGYVDVVDSDFDGAADTFDNNVDGVADVHGGSDVYGGTGYDPYGWGSYTPDELAAGYSSYDTSFIEPARSAGANSLISDNNLSSVL